MLLCGFRRDRSPLKAVKPIEVTQARRHAVAHAPSAAAGGSGISFWCSRPWDRFGVSRDQNLPYAVIMTALRPPTPQEAFELLLAGNKRFVAGAPQHPNQDAARRTETAPGQRPFAILFGCSDSRLAAEIIFDRGLGDLFVVRTAGHVVGVEVLGSIEYGTNVLDCPLVVVLGHDSCGAVGAACDALDNGSTPDGYVRDVVERVMPSVLASRAAGGTTADEILTEHVKRTVDLLLDRSHSIAERVRAGQTAVVGLCYRLADGSAQVVAVHGSGFLPILR
jgi:carbonic anhydrase